MSPAKPKLLFYTKFVIGILVLDCVLPFAICLLIFRIQAQTLFGDSSKFCSQNDAAYQTLLENGESWMSDFPEEYSSLVRSHRFFVEGIAGRVYYAHGYWEETPAQGKPTLFYVMTGTDRAEVGGSAGYVYVPEGELTSPYWLDNYKIRHLSEQIYCYTLK